MSTNVWRVTHFQSEGPPTLIATIPATHTTEAYIVELLRMLYAKEYLTTDEIVESHLRRNTKKFVDNFQVTRTNSSREISFTVRGRKGTSSFHARVIHSSTKQS